VAACAANLLLNISPARAIPPRTWQSSQLEAHREIRGVEKDLIVFSDKFTPELTLTANTSHHTTFPGHEGTHDSFCNGIFQVVRD